MVSLIISHDGAVHKETERGWKSSAPEMKAGWVLKEQSVLRDNAVIVGKFFNKCSCVSEAWRKAHHEEWNDEPEGPPARMPTAKE